MRDVIQQALAAFEAGDARRCRVLIETLVSDTRGNPPSDDLAVIDAQIRQAMERPTIAALDWLCLALDRLRGAGLVPVPLALRTALNCLEAEEGRGNATREGTDLDAAEYQSRRRL
jgi:hypothetical protein